MVKPSIGICKIKAIRRLEIEDRVEDYYVIQSGEVDVLVPRKLADNGAIRKPVTPEELEELMKTIESPYRPQSIVSEEDLPSKYKMSAQLLKNKVRQRDPVEMVEMIRLLYNKQHDYVLDKKESEALDSLMNMLVEEIAYVQKTTKARAKNQVTKLLSAGRKEGRRQLAAQEM